MNDEREATNWIDDGGWKGVDYSPSQRQIKIGDIVIKPIGMDDPIPKGFFFRGEYLVCQYCQSNAGKIVANVDSPTCMSYQTFGCEKCKKEEDSDHY